MSDTLQVILRGRFVAQMDPKTVTPTELGAAMTGVASGADDEPGADEPGADEPGADEPGADGPGPRTSTSTASNGSSA